MNGEEQPQWRGRWVLYAIGTAMIGWGIRGLRANTSHRELIHALRFIGVGLVLHDAIVAPIVFGLAFVIIRALPVMMRPPVQAGLFVAGVVTLLAIPLLRSPGRSDNSSVNPLDYGLHLTLLLVAIAGGVLTGIVVQMIRSRRMSRSGS